MTAPAPARDRRGRAPGGGVVRGPGVRGGRARRAGGGGARGAPPLPQLLPFFGRRDGLLGPDGGCEVLHGGKPQVRVLGERARDRGREAARDPGTLGAGERRLLIDVLVDDGMNGVAPARQVRRDRTEERRGG